ncbi:DUF1996 domain-containing protein [Actinacidiphila sp. bgisy160]|uniref:DUF1996 domain-containing protein n=1 Tax=Actinacidiphila sp. bgisy160 TaxID=3413796 RepID=UPI003D73CD02
MRPMTRNGSRARRRNTTLVAATALLLGGGVIATLNVSASAGEYRNRQGAAPTVDCPKVSRHLPDVPSRARAEVRRNLEQLGAQIEEANRRLRTAQRRGQADEDFVRNAVLGPLSAKRKATLDRIATAIDRVAARPSGLVSLAACTVKGIPSSAGPSASPSATLPSGPTADDFVDITTVAPNVKHVRNRRGASTGTFVSRCGVNAQKRRNTDNVIVAPGVPNGAHHTHDYVGNDSTDFQSTDDSLAAAGTSCTNGDKSSYYWPVLRVQDGTRETDADQLGGGLEGNIGRIVTADQATISFRGSPVGKVTAMPRFLRIITGDAKAFTNGTANANAHWSCTGYENRVQLTDKYPLCPRGSRVVRSYAFQNCWDGKNTDSANHRSHVAFARPDGRCPQGFRAIPQLVMRLVYNVPAKPNFAVDGFPEQLHKPITDHDDFINVMPDRLMRRAVYCINSGRRC